MPARTTTWFASDFTAEDPPRNDPRLTGSSALPKGASSAADEWPPAAEEAVRRDQWEIFLQITSGEISQADAARRWAVDVSTIIGIRRTVKDAAMAALARTPGRP